MVAGVMKGDYVVQAEEEFILVHYSDAVFMRCEFRCDSHSGK